MPCGPSRNADGTPVPIIVLMMPLVSILRMRVVSAMYNRPAASRAIAMGPWNAA